MTTYAALDSTLDSLLLLHHAIDQSIVVIYCRSGCARLLSAIQALRYAAVNSVVLRETLPTSSSC